MKPRSSKHPGSPRSEMKGVIKEMTGKLTNDPALEKEGHEEMLGSAESEARSGKGQGGRRKPLDPDPHRRG